MIEITNAFKLQEQKYTYKDLSELIKFFENIYKPNYTTLTIYPTYIKYNIKNEIDIGFETVKSIPYKTLIITYKAIISLNEIQSIIPIEELFDKFQEIQKNWLNQYFILHNKYKNFRLVQMKLDLYYNMAYEYKNSNLQIPIYFTFIFDNNIYSFMSYSCNINEKYIQQYNNQLSNIKIEYKVDKENKNTILNIYHHPFVIAREVLKQEFYDKSFIAIPDLNSGYYKITNIFNNNLIYTMPIFEVSNFLNYDAEYLKKYNDFHLINSFYLLTDNIIDNEFGFLLGANYSLFKDLQFLLTENIENFKELFITSKGEIIKNEKSDLQKTKETDNLSTITPLGFTEILREYTFINNKVEVELKPVISKKHEPKIKDIIEIFSNFYFFSLNNQYNIFPLEVYTDFANITFNNYFIKRIKDEKEKIDTNTFNVNSKKTNPKLPNQNQSLLDPTMFLSFLMKLINR